MLCGLTVSAVTALRIMDLYMLFALEIAESTSSLPKIDLDSISSLPHEKEVEISENKEDKNAPASWSDDDDLESDDEVMVNICFCLKGSY